MLPEAGQPQTGLISEHRPLIGPSVFETLFSFRVLLAAGLVAVFILSIGNRFNDPDLWFHLKLGEVIWNTHKIPSTDLFSHTAYGHPWIAHEWLAQVTIYAAYRLAGYAGLMGWFILVGSTLWVLVFALGYRQARNELAAFLVAVLSFYLGTIGLAIRPQLMGYTFLATEFLLLEAAARNPRYLFAIPPLFAIWVNCHGSYSFGLGVLGVYWICSFVKGKWGFIAAEGGSRDDRRRLSWTLVLSILALFANPVGWRLPIYPIDLMFHQSTGLSAVTEWAAPQLQDGRTLAMLAAIMGIPLMCLLLRTELKLRELLILGAASFLALQHVRLVFVFGIAVSPILCRIVGSELKRGSEREHPVANVLLILALAAVSIRTFPDMANIQGQIAKDNPVKALDFIRQSGIHGPMLNEYIFGGYLIWAMPQEKVFVDGRSDVFDWTGVLAEYGRWATLEEDPQLLLNKYGIRLCILTKNSPVGHVMEYLPGWRKAYGDNVAVVFVR